MSRSLVYVTTPDMAEAQSLAAMIVSRRLAACANILPGMKSVYQWKGKIEQAEEVVLIAKTRSELVPELTSAIAEAHSYEVPCVVALPIEGGHPPFLQWIDDETAG